ncbi:hypothetical protein PMAYCL1PPCAC_01453, partial [Pristionchus mayeri]
LEMAPFLKNKSNESIKSPHGVGGKRDGTYFPFLDLPNELISKVLPYLEMRDRLRLRVNKRLKGIESKSTYFFKKLTVGWDPNSSAPHTNPSSSSSKNVLFIDGRVYSSGCMRRISESASIECMEINLSGSDEFHREVCNFIKTIDGTTLDLRIQNDEFEKEIIGDAFFLDLATRFKEVTIDRSINVTAEALHQVYKNLIDGSSKLRKFHTRIISKDEGATFFRRIGIAFRNDEFFSKRNIEAFGKFYGPKMVEFTIFEGPLEISCSNFRLDFNGKFEIKLHDSNATLEEAKKFARGYKIKFVSSRQVTVHRM